MFVLNCSYWINSGQISMNPMIYCTRGKHTNHYTTDEVFKILSCHPCWGNMLSCWENLLFLFSSYSLLWFQMWNFSKCLFRVCIFTDCLNFYFRYMVWYFERYLCNSCDNKCKLFLCRIIALNVWLNSHYQHLINNK